MFCTATVPISSLLRLVHTRRPPLLTLTPLPLLLCLLPFLRPLFPACFLCCAQPAYTRWRPARLPPDCSSTTTSVTAP